MSRRSTAGRNPNANTKRKRTRDESEEEESDSDSKLQLKSAARPTRTAKRKANQTDLEDEPKVGKKTTAKAKRGAANPTKRAQQKGSDYEEEDSEEERNKKKVPAKGKRANEKENEKKVHRKEEEEEDMEEDEDQAVPKTPQIERAKAICTSVKRHLARPLDESTYPDQDKSTIVPQTPRISKLRGTEVVSKGDYDELLERFNQLKALRTTKSEKMYAKLQTATDAREKASAKFIDSLKNENKRLRDELAQKDSKSEKKESKPAGEDQPQVEQAKAVLQFMRQLTLVDAQPHPEEGTDAFLCSCKNPNDRRALKFVLTVAEDAVEYKPIEIGKQPNWEMNEMFIKEIYFSPQFAPIFLSKLLATVYGTKKPAK